MEGAGQVFLPLSSFRWNAIPFKSFRRDYIKELDLEQFLRLPGAAAKRAYRFLDKSLPTAESLDYDLCLFACEKVGMSRKYKPSRLMTEVQATVVDPQIDYLDFLIESGERPMKPAGWLRSAIEQDYGPPAGYQMRAERFRQQQAAEDNHRRKGEEQAARRRQEEQEAAARKAERAHIDAYLNSLTPQERKSLEEQAVAHADDTMRQAASLGNSLADITRLVLLDQEVLRVHPQPNLSHERRQQSDSACSSALTCATVLNENIARLTLPS